MNQIVVVANFRAKEGAEAQLMEALRTAVRSTVEEEGCLRYALHRSTDDPRNLKMIERWTSSEDLERHLESSHIKTLFSVTAPLLEQPAIISTWQPLTDDLGDLARL